MLVLLLSLLLAPFAATDATVSLGGQSGYSSQRSCAGDCFTGFLNPAGWAIATLLSCQTSPIYNDCMCRQDLQGSATSFLSSCVSSRCDGDPLDISSAVSIYTAYCTGAGYVQAGVTAAPSSQGAYTVFVTEATATVTVTRVVDKNGGVGRGRGGWRSAPRSSHLPPTDDAALFTLVAASALFLGVLALVL